MSCNEYLTLAAIVFLCILESPCHSSGSIIKNFVNSSLGKQSVVSRYDGISCIKKLVIYVFLTSLNATTMKPYHYRHILLVSWVINIKLATLFGIGIILLRISEIIHSFILGKRTHNAHKEQ